LLFYVIVVVIAIVSFVVFSLASVIVIAIVCVVVFSLASVVVVIL